MKLDLLKPILYLITRGATSDTTTAESREFQEILKLVSAASAAGIDLIQIREKKLNARVLSELTERAVALTAGTPTRILVNDRADIAVGTGAGVHLTTQSLNAGTVRRTFGDDLLIGASTHSIDEARAARDHGADFVVFGPIFETGSKVQYGEPVGLEPLSKAAGELTPFPLLALGGISIENAVNCLRAGASGVAGISLFANRLDVRRTVDSLRSMIIE
jgi:thiamine-phosphate pyrophosphorylase